MGLRRRGHLRWRVREVPERRGAGPDPRLDPPLHSRREVVRGAGRSCDLPWRDGCNPDELGGMAGSGSLPRHHVRPRRSRPAHPGGDRAGGLHRAVNLRARREGDSGTLHQTDRARSRPARPRCGRGRDRLRLRDVPGSRSQGLALEWCRRGDTPTTLWAATHPRTGGSRRSSLWRLVCPTTITPAGGRHQVLADRD
jgi:hypothetical protein